MAEIAYQQTFGLAVESFKQRQYEPALQLFSELINKHPDRFAPVLNRGTIYLQLSLLSQALADFDRSIELDPRDPSAYFNRAIVKLKENRPADALSDLYVTLSCLYLLKGQQSRELKYLTKAISLVENNVYAHLERGKLYKIQGNPVLAENDFSSAIELDPTLAEAYALRGSLYNDLKREEAASDLKQVLLLESAKRRSDFKLDPQLKFMNDAVLHQEILVKLREISEIKLTVYGSRAESSPTSREAPSYHQTHPPSASLPSEVENKQVAQVVLNNSSEAEKPKMHISIAQSQPSEQLLISDFPDKHNTEKSPDTSNIKPLDDHSYSRGEDSYAMEDKIGKIETEIKELRQEMIEEGNNSEVFDSRVDDNIHNLSDSLAKILTDRSKKDDKEQGEEHQPSDNVKTSVDMQSKAETQLTKEARSENVEELTTPSSATHQQQAEKNLSHSNSVNSQRAKTTLEIEIVAAGLIHDTELLGKMAPFCVINFGKEERKTEVVQNGGKNPIWNEKIYFPIKEANERVKVTVWDKETMKNDDFVGSGEFIVDDATTKCDLFFQGSPAGIVYVRLRLL